MFGFSEEKQSISSCIYKIKWNMLLGCHPDGKSYLREVGLEYKMSKVQKIGICSLSKISKSQEDCFDMVGCQLQPIGLLLSIYLHDPMYDLMKNAVQTRFNLRGHVFSNY